MTTVDKQLATLGKEVFLDPRDHPEYEIPESIFHVKMTFESSGAITAAEIRRRHFLYSLRDLMFVRGTQLATHSVRHYLRLATIFVAVMSVGILVVAIAMGKGGKMVPESGVVQQLMQYKQQLGGHETY